jgi:hypothetical protein
LPFTQVPPPSDAKGSGVVQPPGVGVTVDGGGAPTDGGGGGGVGVGDGEGGAGGSDGSEPAGQANPSMPERVVEQGAMAPEIAMPNWDQACEFVIPATWRVSAVDGMTKEGDCWVWKTSKLSFELPLKLSTTTRSETMMFGLVKPATFGSYRRKMCAWPPKGDEPDTLLNWTLRAMTSRGGIEVPPPVTPYIVSV